MDFSPEDNIQTQQLRTFLSSAIYRIKGIHVVSVMKLKSKAYLLCGKKYSHYVPNGLSLRRNAPAEVSREERRAELGIPEGEKLCLLLGWDKYRKGMDIAIKAVARYRQQDPTLHLGIIGLDWIREMTGIDSSCQWLHFSPALKTCSPVTAPQMFTSPQAGKRHSPMAFWKQFPKTPPLLSVTSREPHGPMSIAIAMSIL